MNGSEALVRMLEQAGVEVIFGLCGDTSLPLYDAFREHADTIRHVLTRDERSASFMADCYARLSGKVGVCEGPSGGGATYLAPGVVEANLSSVPLLAITTDIDSRIRDRGTLTELDQDAFYAPLTRWTRTPSHSDELPWAVRQALRRAASGQMGAVHLGLAYDVQEGQVPEDDAYIDPASGSYPLLRSGPDPAELKLLAELLLSARNPLIIAGAGVLRSGAWEELGRVVELLGCPVATSISGKGAMAETHPLALGVIGSNGGLPFRHELVRQADLLFYVGCRAGSVTTEKWTLPPDRAQTIVQLDVCPSWLGANYQVASGVVCDAKLGLDALGEELADRLGGRPREGFDRQRLAALMKEHLEGKPQFHSDESPIRPERLITELKQVLPEDAIVVSDPGTATPYLAAYWPVPRAGRWFVAPRAHGGLGYSLPAVVGAKLARPQCPVIGFIGDGGFAFSVGELETIARLNLPVTLVVIANGCFGWVKAGQKVRGGRYFGVDFSRSDHVRIAEAYGIQAWKVDQPGGLAPTLKEALASNAPALVEVLCQPLHEAQAPVSKWVA